MQRRQRSIHGAHQKPPRAGRHQFETNLLLRLAGDAAARVHLDEDHTRRATGRRLKMTNKSGTPLRHPRFFK
jgi:hypothetical protein